MSYNVTANTLSTIDIPLFGVYSEIFSKVQNMSFALYN